jgi:hypothetical protein
LGSAQPPPHKPILTGRAQVIAFPAGGTIDARAHLGAEAHRGVASECGDRESRGRWRQYRAAAAAVATPDGYTLHFGAQSLAVNVTIAPYQTLNPVKDFDPIILAATATDVLIVSLSPFRAPTN